MTRILQSHQRLALASFILLTLFGCLGPPDDSPIEVGEWTVLPSIAENGLCGRQAPENLCDWGSSTDAIFIGRIVSRELVFFPAATPDGDFVNSCDSGSFDPAVRIQLSIVHSIIGNPRPRDDLVVQVGAAPFRSFRPGAFGASVAEKYWEPEDTLEVGSLIGVSGFQIGPTTYGTGFERMFTFEEKGLSLQGTSRDCHASAPWEHEGLQLADFRKMLSECPIGSGEARRLAMAQRFGEGPVVIFAPICVP